MLKSILVLGTGIAIGMCMYKKKQKNSKSFSTDSDTDSLISKDNNKVKMTIHSIMLPRFKVKCKGSYVSPLNIFYKINFT